MCFFFFFTCVFKADFLDPITSDLFREEEKEYTHKRGEDKEQMEAETIVIGPQTEKCHQPPEIGSK